MEWIKTKLFIADLTIAEWVYENLSSLATAFADRPKFRKVTYAFATVIIVGLIGNFIGLFV